MKDKVRREAERQPEEAACHNGAEEQCEVTISFGERIDDTAAAQLFPTMLRLNDGKQAKKKAAK